MMAFMRSMVTSEFVRFLMNFFISKHVIFIPERTHPLIARAAGILREHAWALALAFIAGAITIAPHIMLWNDPGYRGIEMMMLDAENHYFARVHEVYEGNLGIGNTFLSEKDTPYATPPLGEIIIAGFGKVLGVDAARAAVISKPFSLFVITILIYALAFSLTRSRTAALIGAAFPVFAYNLIAFSPAPLLNLIQGSPAGGPFLFFSRLVNPSISGMFLFGALVLMYRILFEHYTVRWWSIGLLGTLIAASLYTSPFVYSFLGVLLLITWIRLLMRSEHVSARAAFFAGVVALAFSIPFALNYVAFHALPEYENVARYLGVVSRREFVLGSLLPLMAMLVALLWTRFFSREGRAFLLLACAAVFIAMNQQLITGTTLQLGHYHWFITKPLAGLVAGIFIGGLIERFVHMRFQRGITLCVIGILVYNSMGFFAPWYDIVRKDVYDIQAYEPLVRHLSKIDISQTVWADETTSDYIPIYTAHNAPNTINLGSYPIPGSYFDDRLFLEYRLRGVSAEDFAETIRAEAEHVSGRLWGVWLRELKGDPTAIPEEEYRRLVSGYAGFYGKKWSDAFDALGITLVVARTSDRAAYDAIPALRETAIVGDFVIYGMRD